MSAAITANVPSAAAWRRLAPALLLLAALLLLFHDTAASMVGIWIRSETFAHAFLVPPIVVWLVWRRRETLARLQPRPAPWVLLPMAGACLLWLLGDLIGANVATHLALVSLLVLSVPALFGLQVARALTFPLLFLFFAAPVGEFMVPRMMAWTADFTVAALQLSRVPVYREGLQFVIPTGSWGVVEACSGVRYLIASFMVGTLFAYLNFQSPRRRVIFMLVALLLPVLANWVRAYLIVMLGHLSGNKLAAGVDHIIYGWAFFGVVIGAMFLIGARWAEPDPAPAVGPKTVDDAQAAPQVRRSLRSEWLVGGAALLLLLAVQGVQWQLTRAAELGAPQLALPATSAAGWPASATPLADWRPNYAGAVLDTSRTYTEPGVAPSYQPGSQPGSQPGAQPGAAPAPRQVAVWLAYYRDQGVDRKLVTSTNTLVEQDVGSSWGVVEGDQPTSATLPDGTTQPLLAATLRGSADVGNTQAQRLRVWQVYWIGGKLTTSGTQARLQLALNRLLGRGDDGAALFFYTPVAGTTASATQAADDTLASIVGKELPALAAALSAAHGTSQPR